MSPTLMQTWVRGAGGVWKRPGLADLTEDRFAPGTVQPIGSLDAGTRNVGTRQTSGLTASSGLTMESGGVYEGYDITGRVQTVGTLANLPILRDSIVRGPLPSGAQDNSARGSNGNFSGALFEFVTWDRTGRESAFSSTIEGGGYTMRYCELLRSVDAIGGNSTGDAIIECCRIYHGYYMAWWNDATGAVRTTTFTDYGGTSRPAPFPGQSSGDTHSDGVQLQAGSGWEIRGNYIGGPRGYLGAWSSIDPTVAADYAIMAALDADSGYANSAIMINGNQSNPIGAMIEKNWLAGGACRVNLAPSGTDQLAGVTVRDNRFIRQSDASTPNYNILTNGSAATVSGNVWDDTGAALP